VTKSTVARQSPNLPIIESTQRKEINLREIERSGTSRRLESPTNKSPPTRERTTYSEPDKIANPADPRPGQML